MLAVATGEPVWVVLTVLLVAAFLFSELQQPSVHEESAASLRDPGHDGSRRRAADVSQAADDD